MRICRQVQLMSRHTTETYQGISFVIMYNITYGLNKEDRKTEQTIEQKIH